MIKNTTRPTFEECLEWARTLPSDFEEFRKELAYEESLYFQTFPIDAPFGRMGVKTGSAPADVDAAIDLLTPKTIDVKWRPLRKKDRYIKKAAKLEKAAKGLMHHIRRPKDKLRAGISDMTIHRVGVMRMLWDDDAWPEEPKKLPEVKPERHEDETEAEYNERILVPMDPEDREYWQATKRRKNPLVLEQRPVMDCAWKEHDDDLMVVVESKIITVLEAKATFKYETVDDICRGKSLNDVLVNHDVWFGAYRCIILDDRPVFPLDMDNEYRGVAAHGYPSMPYLIAGFRELPFSEPHKRFRGLLTNAAQLYPAESQIYTMNLWMLGWNAWRTWAGHFRDKNKNPQIVPGQFIPIDKRAGEYLEMLQGQPVPPELLQMAMQFGAMIARNGLQSGPAAGENSRSAAQLWAQQSVKQLKIEAATQAAQLMVEQMISNAFELMEARMGPNDHIVIPVPGKDAKTGEIDGEIELSIKDIDGDWDGATVSFGSRIDPALLEQWSRVANLVANKFLPKKMGWELAGTPYTPAELQDQLYLEATDELPFMVADAALERYRQYYGEESERYQRLYKKMYPPNEPGPDGEPQAPAAGADPMAGPSPMAGAGLQQPKSPMAPNSGAGGGGPNTADLMGQMISNNMHAGGGAPKQSKGGAKAKKPSNMPG